MALFNYYPYSNFHELNLDWLIKIVKKYTEETDALEIKVDDFIAYVTNYLENLDVQEEIDQKLEEMKENGELAELIAEFLQTTSLIVFKTKALMKSAENLADGITVLTDGTDAYNDGETRLYYIRNMTSSDVVDEVNLVSLTNYPTLVAEWLKDNYSGVFDSIKDEMVDYAEQNMDFNNTSVFNDIKDEMLDYVEDNIEYRKTSITEIWVNEATGSDDNDGLAYNRPLQTLQKAIDYVNKGETDILIKLMTSGDYTITSDRFTGFSWHMTISEAGLTPTVHFRNGCSIYDCHINWANFTADGGVYQEGSYGLYTNIKFLHPFNSNGSFINMNDCTYCQLVLSRTNFTIGTSSNDKSIYLEPNANLSQDTTSLIVIRYGSNGRISGKLMINQPPAQIANIINVILGCTVSIQLTPTKNYQGADATYGLTLSSSVCFMTAYYINLLAALGQSGNNLGSPSLMVTTQQQI